ncbi:MAG TPA: tetratricopeptide repeat protein, partial [Candidatus Scalindua sp.]|nr:tetratricopeptide repeat protein [Candidatus Scalindua sp.]
MESFHTDKYKKPPQLTKENFFLKYINFIKEGLVWYFYEKDTLEVKIKQKDSQLEDLRSQLNIVNHMYEEGRNLLKEQKRDLEDMLKVERKGANIPSLLQLDKKQPRISQRSQIKINKLKAKIERLTKAGIPTELEGYYEIGLTSYYNDRIDEAIKQWETIIRLDKHNINTNHNLGIAYYKIGRYDEAISTLCTIVNSNPKDHTPYYCLGLAYNKKQNFLSAISEFKKALSIHPDDDAIYYNLGLSYDHNKETDEAIDTYNKAIELNAEHIDAIFHLGILYRKKELFNKAITELKKVISADTSNVRAHYYLGC